MNEKLTHALAILEQAIEAERHSVPETWQHNRVALDRATACVQRLVSQASALDRISARRTLTAILHPQTAVSAS